MKILSDPLSIMRVIKKNISKYKIVASLVFITLSIAIITYNVCDINHRQTVFNKLDVTFTEVKAVEYGTADYDPIDLVENVPYGKIVNYTSYVDTNSIGTQKLMFVVEDENVTKVINVEVEVVDTEKPEIKTEEETISIEEGNEYNIKDNIKSVTDKVDGDLEFVEAENEEKKSYYTISTDLDTNTAGNYSVNIKAVDQSGNTTEKTYNINVVEKPKPQPQPVITYSNNMNNNANHTVDTSSVVSAAYSFVGYNYTPGGASPSTGFDCSGFVQYIYSLFGKNVGRTTGDQANVGYGISRESMEPGDIIVWSDNGMYPTHSTLYVGNGIIVHAANSRDGVITSTVESWERYAGSIVAIRRV